MQHCVGGTASIVRSLVCIGCLLLVQKTHAYRDNKDRVDSESAEDDKVSNYDFYKPLNQRKKERKYYVEGDEIVHKEHAEPTDDLSPYLIYKNQRQKWLKEKDSNVESTDKESYGYGNDEDVKEQPRYGFHPDESYEVTKPKNPSHDSSWNDGTSARYKELTNEKYPLKSWKQPYEKSPYKHSEDEYELKTSYPKVYKAIDEYSTDIKDSNPKAWNSHEGSPPLNDYKIKTEYKKEGLLRDVNKYESVNNKELHGIQNEYKHPYSEHQYATKENYYSKPELINEDKKGYSQNYYSKPQLINEDKKEYNQNYYSKPQLINEDKKEYKHEYLHPSKEEKQPAVAGLLHDKLGDEDDFGKYLKSEYLKIRPFTTSKFNHGGHIYGWSYKPYEYLHQKYLADLDIKKFLQEHEKKFAEMQKKHMESFKKFMNKEFLGAKHKYPEFRIPAIDAMHSKPNHQTDSHKHYDSEPLKHDVSSETHHYNHP
ncbi:hypothetical protein HNY73_010559 [Argiope bruennichi]|uniref:Uncharacterized protein n=1 Tax=Argiope bruennichi TaxID=94029 RepID=A0A8T0F3C5_ARGBR|nr:hypothetical protein HNY73_010559 [Argiope bruennichi]